MAQKSPNRCRIPARRPTGTVGLAVNIIVFWSTLYTDTVMEQLRTGEDPICEHINVLGHYAFALPETVVQGQLRNPATPTERASRSLNRFLVPLLPEPQGRDRRVYPV